MNPRSRIVQDGLVLYLDAGMLESYPGDGSIWHDLSGNNYDASIYGAPTFNSGIGGGVFTYDSCLSQYVTGPISSCTSLAYTASWNMYPTKFYNWNFVFSVDVSNFWQYWLFHSSANGWIYTGTTGVTAARIAYTTNGIVPINEWHNWTCSFYNGQMKVYKDASLFVTKNITAPSLIPIRYSITSVDGNISHFSFYNRRLSDSEILQNYRTTATRFKTIKPLRVGNTIINMFNENSYKLIEDGLIQHLDAANSNSYPGDGSIWYNLKSTNNGTIQTDLVFDPSYGGNFVFNGNDKIQFTSTLNGATLSFWFKTISAAEQVIIGGIYTSSVYSVQLRNNKLGTMGMETIRNNLNDGIWHNAVFIYTGLASPDTYQIYVDGKIEPVQTGGPSRVCSPEKIVGCRLYKSTYEYYFNGSLANILSYNRILTPSEIKINYLSLKDRFR